MENNQLEKQQQAQPQLQPQQPQPQPELQQPQRQPQLQQPQRQPQPQQPQPQPQPQPQQSQPQQLLHTQLQLQQSQSLLQPSQSQMQSQEAKQVPLDQLEQVESDHAFALALQQQESTFTMLETIGSDIEDEEPEEDEEEEDEEEIGSSSSQDFDSNFDTQEFYGELEYLEEEEEGSYADEIEEDEIDPDEMSYEELLALGEVVGEESRGLSTEEITSSLSSYVHKIVPCSTAIDRCVICQIDYEEGEQLAALHCQHPFHTDCINQWLQIKKVCPICSMEITPSQQGPNPGKI